MGVQLKKLSVTLDVWETVPGVNFFLPNACVYAWPQNVSHRINHFLFRHLKKLQPHRVSHQMRFMKFYWTKRGFCGF